MENRQNHLLTYEGLADYDKLIKEYIPVAPGDGEDSIVMGGNTGNVVTGDRSIALGRDNEVTGDRSITLGKNNEVNTNDSIAIGEGLEINLSSEHAIEYDIAKDSSSGTWYNIEKNAICISYDEVSPVPKTGDLVVLADQKFTVTQDLREDEVDISVSWLYINPVLSEELQSQLDMEIDTGVTSTLKVYPKEKLSSKQVVIGKYNVSQDNLLFSIGNGTSNRDRKSVFKIPALNSEHISFNRYSNRDGVDVTTTFNIAPGQISLWDGKDETAVSHLFIERDKSKWTEDAGYRFYVNSSGGKNWGGHTSSLVLYPNKTLIGNLVSEGTATFKSGLITEAGQGSYFNSASFFKGDTYFYKYTQFGEEVHFDKALKTYDEVSFEGSIPKFHHGFWVGGNTSSSIEGSLTVQNLYTGNGGIKSENGSVTMGAFTSGNATINGSLTMGSNQINCGPIYCTSVDCTSITSTSISSKAGTAHWQASSGDTVYWGWLPGVYGLFLVDVRIPGTSVDYQVLMVNMNNHNHKVEFSYNSVTRVVSWNPSTGALTGTNCTINAAYQLLSFHW